MTTYIYLCVVWVLFIGFTGAIPTRTGNCIEYCNTDVPPVASNVENVCIKENNCTYCLFVPKCCPDVDSCANPQESRVGDCLICPGETCVYDGNAYAVDETFTSVDEVNECTCKPNGFVKCGKLPLPNKMDFCW